MAPWAKASSSLGALAGSPGSRPGRSGPGSPGWRPAHAGPAGGLVVDDAGLSRRCGTGPGGRALPAWPGEHPVGTRFASTPTSFQVSPAAAGGSRAASSLQGMKVLQVTWTRTPWPCGTAPGATAASSAPSGVKLRRGRIEGAARQTASAQATAMAARSSNVPGGARQLSVFFRSKVKLPPGNRAPGSGPSAVWIAVAVHGLGGA